MRIIDNTILGEREGRGEEANGEDYSGGMNAMNFQFLLELALRVASFAENPPSEVALSALLVARAILRRDCSRRWLCARIPHCRIRFEDVESNMSLLFCVFKRVCFLMMFIEESSHGTSCERSASIYLALSVHQFFEGPFSLFDLKDRMGVFFSFRYERFVNASYGNFSESCLAIIPK